MIYTLDDLKARLAIEWEAIESTALFCFHPRAEIFWKTTVDWIDISEGKNDVIIFSSNPNLTGETREGEVIFTIDEVPYVCTILLKPFENNNSASLFDVYLDKTEADTSGDTITAKVTLRNMSNLKVSYSGEYTNTDNIYTFTIPANTGTTRTSYIITFSADNLYGKTETKAFRITLDEKQVTVIRVSLSLSYNSTIAHGTTSFDVKYTTNADSVNVNILEDSDDTLTYTSQDNYFTFTCPENDSTINKTYSIKFIPVKNNIEYSEKALTATITHTSKGQIIYYGTTSSSLFPTNFTALQNLQSQDSNSKSVEASSFPYYITVSGGDSYLYCAIPTTTCEMSSIVDVAESTDVLEDFIEDNKTYAYKSLGTYRIYFIYVYAGIADDFKIKFTINKK